MKQVTNRPVFLLGKQEMRSFAKQERKRQAVSWGNGDENRMTEKQQKGVPAEDGHGSARLVRVYNRSRQHGFVHPTTDIQEVGVRMTGLWALIQKTRAGPW